MQNISLKEQLKMWSYVAINSFGGPAAQIAVIHKIIVEDKKLISEERFLHALNFCMLLPGPEAQQLATYIGYLMGKWRGGLLAGGLFILPGFLSILLLSYLYVTYSNLFFVQGLFYGIKPAIIAIVLASLYKIAKRSLKSSFAWGMAFFAFLSLFFFNISFPWIIASSAVLGIMYGKFFPPIEQIKNDIPNTLRPPFYQTIKTLFCWILVWLTPIIITLLIWGKNSTFHQMNLFFSKMSMVTFGGAYAALNYVAQQAVEHYGWLQWTEMLDGLAMAETTPGPLIQTVQFVGFMGAYRFSDMSSPLMAALVGSVLTTWMTFAPCFLWIFTFAPYVEHIRNKKNLSNALQAITASVVGVILNLSLWFALNTLFTQSKKIKYFWLNFHYPVLNSIDMYATVICFVAIFLLFKFKQSLFMILFVSVALGVLIKSYIAGAALQSSGLYYNGF